jgi:DNA-binding transcriptional MerR regulator
MTDQPPTPPGREPADEQTFSLAELAAHADVTPRTVHYYISQGLLPASGALGRGSRYGQAHLDRLRLIRRLQREHLPLAEIRQRLARLSDGQVADLLTAGEIGGEPANSAFEYIQSVLAGTDKRLFTVHAASAPRRMAAPVPPPPGGPAAPGQPPAAAALFAAPAAPSPASAAGEPATPGSQDYPLGGSGPAMRRTAVGEELATYGEEPALTRSQWERIAIAPDVELHVRRPLSRPQNRAVDRLIAFARKLFEEGT